MMHWVWATAPEGTRVIVNLAAIPTMLRATRPNGEEVTRLFLGGMAFNLKGEASFAETHVVETPEELLALPTVEVGSLAARSQGNGKSKPSARGSK